MMLSGLFKLFKLPNGTLTTDENAGGTPYGARVMWLDKPVQDYVVTDLPNNLGSAAAVETYFNTITGTGPNGEVPGNQSRVGSFLGCYAFAKVFQFTKNVSVDFDLTISSDPTLTNPYV